ncbi:MAG: hypothetical protein KBC46_02205 [Ferrovibrio sp.]|nr:hypothetical protein [Ferrovibrio sp.]
MRIQRKRIISTQPYLADIGAGEQFYVVYRWDGILTNKIRNIGFRDQPLLGQTVLPAHLGPVSRFNALGRWNIRRDLPKESRYITTVMWTRRQWTGGGSYEEVTDLRPIYKDCFPRELVPPPSIELTYIISDGEKYFSSPAMTNEDHNKEIQKHCINLFLEIFGECEIVKVDEGRFVRPEISRINWRMLPPGEYPWSKLEPLIKHAVRRLSDRSKYVISDRQETIMQFCPDKIFIGEGGFSDYLAYIFTPKNLVILESIRLDNALYVFGSDWMAISQLSKAEVLNEGVHKDRIVHGKGWKTRLAKILDPKN